MSEPPIEPVDAPKGEVTPAVGLFGYSIYDGEIRTFRSTVGYLREMEQMPNFSPPSIERFVAQYLASHLKHSEAADNKS